MRRRVPLKRADEYNAFTRWRHIYHWQRGELRKLKRRLSKRERRTKDEDIAEQTSQVCASPYCTSEETATGATDLHVDYSDGDGTP